MGDIMQQRFALVLAAAIAVLAVSGCGGQQPATDVDRTKEAEPEPSALSATAATAATPSPELPKRVPATGRPSAQFCDAGEKYLAKFPGLPRVQPPAGSSTPPAANICAYTAVIGDITKPIASLGALDLAGDDAELAIIRKSCTDGTGLAPGATKIDAVWVQSRGWSGWTITNGADHQAMLCTNSHFFSASLSNVPGSTPEDALNTILAAMD